MSTTNQNATSQKQARFMQDVISGLESTPKRLSCKYLYDERGSQLFDEICDTDDYYLTRTELAIMQQFGGPIAERVGSQSMIVEFGSGSSTKTRILLDHLDDPVAYCPVDISREHLLATARSMAADYTDLEVLPIAADFTRPFALPSTAREPRRITIYFPGSTIGNFEPKAAAALFTQMANVCGDGGGLLIGIDLQKDIKVVEAAYNDREGVTDAFSLNLLTRINRELDADFDEDRFRHYAFYDTQNGRVDIRLISECEQTVRVGDHQFEFDAGEPILTEYSHKYSIEGFAAMAADAGFQLQQYWTDERRYFGVLFFEFQE